MALITPVASLAPLPSEQGLILVSDPLQTVQLPQEPQEPFAHLAILVPESVPLTQEVETLSLSTHLQGPSSQSPWELQDFVRKELV